ncbi:LPS export ABC transporter periplasmic protein LptC [bacterium]
MNYLILFLIVSLFIGCSNNSDLEKQKSDKTTQTDNIRTFLLKEMVAGKKHWKLTGTKAFIDRDPDYIIVENPIIVFYKNEKESSKLTADIGKINKNTQNMQAIGNVIMNSIKEKTILTTEEVFYKNSESIFYSDKYVKIQRENTITEGTGFESQADLSVITIKNNVSISYKES